MNPSLLKNVLRKARFAALTWTILLAWVGCSDPGSGGSGIPSTTTQGSTASSPAPAPASAPSSVITALTADSVTISGTSFALADIEVSAPSASTALDSPNLAVGMQVHLTDRGVNTTPRYLLMVISR